MAGSRTNGAEEGWAPARLIPVIGIRGQQEQEGRAASSLLAVMGAVPAFGRALLKPVGGPAGRISTFTEVPLKSSATGKGLRPDGVICVERGKRTWRALVEVKTGTAELRSEQVEGYLGLAREHDFDAVLTISNQIRRSADDLPVTIDKRKVGKKVALRHISWWRIITEAVTQYRHRGIEDLEQAWILGELIAYLDHPKSGAGGFEDMGEQWVSVRNAAQDGTLRASDKAALEVAGRWQQFVEYLALGLGADLGVDVRTIKLRGKSDDERRDGLVRELAQDGTLRGALRIPDAVGPVSVIADLRARRVLTGVEVEAPGEGRPLTRINWMLRQLRDAPESLRLDVHFARTSETSSLLLREAREDPRGLQSATNPKREPRSFDLYFSGAMGTKRGKGERSFVLETRKQTFSFYRDLVQDLNAWRPRPPKLPKGEEEDQKETPAELPPVKRPDEAPRISPFRVAE